MDLTNLLDVVNGPSVAIILMVARMAVDRGCVDALMRDPRRARRLVLLYETLSSSARETLLSEFEEWRDALQAKDATSNAKRAPMGVAEGAHTSWTGAPSSPTPFRHSPRLHIQQHFYKQQGLRAWSQVVPCTISTNRVVASTYLHYIRTAASALRASLGRTPRIAVIDIAAGHGHLSFLMAGDLAATHATGDSHADVTVLATDFHLEALEQSMQEASPFLRASGSRGVHVRTCRLKIDSNHVMMAQDCQGVAAAFRESQKGHSPDLVVLVANYAVDSFPCDLLLSMGTQDKNSLWWVGEKHAHPDYCCHMSNYTPAGNLEGGAEYCRRSTQSVCDHYVGIPCAGPTLRWPSTYPAEHKQDQEQRQAQEQEEAAWYDRVHTIARGERGVHIVPSVMVGLLSCMRRAFSVETAATEPRPGLTTTGTKCSTGGVCRERDPEYMLIVGDVSMPHDDSRWGVPHSWTLPAYVSTAEEGAGAEINGTGSGLCVPVVDLPWFDPPFISPSRDAFAAPVDMRMMREGFEFAFNISAREVLLSPVQSSFTVGIWSSPNLPLLSTTIPSVSGIFSPNEYCVLMDVLPLCKPSPACTAVLTSLSSMRSTAGVAWLLNHRKVIWDAIQQPQGGDALLQTCTNGICSPDRTWWLDESALSPSSSRGVRIAVLQWLLRVATSAPRVSLQRIAMTALLTLAQGKSFTTVCNKRLRESDPGSEVATKGSVRELRIQSPLEALMLANALAVAIGQRFQERQGMQLTKEAHALIQLASEGLAKGGATQVGVWADWCASSVCVGCAEDTSRVFMSLASGPTSAYKDPYASFVSAKKGCLAYLHRLARRLTRRLSRSKPP